MGSGVDSGNLWEHIETKIRCSQKQGIWEMATWARAVAVAWAETETETDATDETAAKAVGARFAVKDCT